VKGLTELEHDVVRDVDDVVDRPHAGRDEAGLHPCGRGTDAHARQQRCRKARARSVIFDPDVETLRRVPAESLYRRFSEDSAEQGRDLARDAHDAKAIRAVGLKLEGEDGLAQHFTKERADGQLRVEDVDPLVLVSEA